MDFSYQGAGLRKMSHEDKDRIFLYVKPCGFAMHDIREGFTDRWYPMRTPPEVGILVAAGEEGRYMVEEGTMHFHGDVYVNGTFVYPLFSSQRNTLKSFCGAEKFHRRPGETWQDSMIRTIMFGVDTLFNGMTDDSMIEYSEGGIKGERHHNRLSALEWITEQQVESEGLYKTNLHDTVSARC